MRNNKKQIIFFLICIVFILGGLFTGIYWMTHVDQFKKNGMSDIHKLSVSHGKIAGVEIVHNNSKKLAE